MASSTANLEEMYARLALEEEEEGGVIVGEEEVRHVTETFVLVGRFLTEKNINFTAMQNVMASLWRPKEGMQIHDLGGHRYSFVFYHVLDMQKVLDAGPWTFEQSLLVYHKLQDNEDPHLVPLNKMDIWLQVYDLPKGLISEKIVQSIGNFVGTFVKSDPANMDGTWKLYVRLRVTMDVEKPLKRRMKIKREGGAWSWVNFKYERLSTFCFVCGLIGHSERDCAVVYAHPDKEIDRAYGTWLRAPGRNTKNQNLGARWLRNNVDGTWPATDVHSSSSNTVHGGDRVAPQFMEVDGTLRGNLGEDGGITVIQRDQGSMFREENISNDNSNHGEKNMGGKLKDMEKNMEGNLKDMEKNMGGNLKDMETVVLDPKRRRVQNTGEIQDVDESAGPQGNNGPKNLLEAGPVIQARLVQ